MMNGKSFLYAGDFAENGLALVQADDEKYGYIDEKGEYVIDPVYHYAYGFAENGLARVGSKSGKWGYIDKNGKYVIRPRFDYAGRFS